MTPEQWERVGQIVNAAVALQPDKRPSFLDQACGRDETLRREVEDWLSLEGKEKGFLSAPAMEEAARLLVEEEPRFSAGKKLGNYELLEFVESGGMGEIYKAHHLTLGNLVALKFLPTALAQDVHRLRRFKQEARAASALNHPNIVTVHDFVEAEHHHFIVSEYVEGQTLRQRLRQGRIDLEEATNIAIQVATGLVAAHAVGIIHRDIKPENIMLRPDGYVKLLDFGLAKLGERSENDLPIESQLKTEPGVKMGTTRYMSPEQACGLALDARTDVWSLGVVIYEMLSGRVPFEGSTNGDVLTSILEHEPAPLATRKFGVPVELQRIVAKALRKDRKERYQNVNDMLLDLKGRSKVLDYENLLNKIKRHKAAAAVVLLGLLVAVAVGPKLARWIYSRVIPPPPPAAMKVSPLTSYLGFESNPAFSPDGKFVAFCWGGEKDDNLDIYVQRVGSTDPPMRVTDDPADDMNPVWSPDGTQIAFARVKSDSDKATYIKSWPSGTERKVYTPKLKAGWGGEKQIDWSPDGKFLVSGDRLVENGPYQLLLISLDTLEFHQLTFSPEHSFGDLHPQFSPDGQYVSFSRFPGPGTDISDIYIVPVGGGDPRRLTSDNKHLEVSTWTADGREIVFASSRGGSMGLWRIPASGGTPEQLPVGERDATTPSISRQGNLLAYVKKTSDTNMYRVRLDRTARDEHTRIASSTQADWIPSFSPDGTQIAFLSDRSGHPEIWLSGSDGSNLRRLTSLESLSGCPRWSPDGQQIVFDSHEKGSATQDVYLIGTQGGAPRRLTTLDQYDDGLPSWSKDGQWIYFTSNRSGDLQVWKVPVTGGDPVQVTKQGGIMPFEVDGKTIYYAKGWVTPGVWSVPINGGEEKAVLNSLYAFWGNWGLTSEGIYYIGPIGPGKNGATIEFYSFVTKRTSRLASLGKVKIGWLGFAVSPDGKSAIYTRVDQEGSDIMLVENFH